MAIRPYKILQPLSLIRNPNEDLNHDHANARRFSRRFLHGLAI
ncbi:hypothetical protein [Planktothricoides raciborskii]|nr:hypothetical protein [Planktothricoides raciborskii]